MPGTLSPELRWRTVEVRRQKWLIIVAIVMLVLTTTPVGASDLYEPNPRPHSAVVDWVDAMLLAIEQNPPAPTATTWRMWVTMSSMYDAWSAYDDSALSTQTGYDLKRPTVERTEANKREAISHAAHRALNFTYPNQKALFDEVLGELGYAPSDSFDPTTPAGIGNISAQAVIDYRVADGSNALGGFVDAASPIYGGLYTPANNDDPNAPNGINGSDFDPNRWTPLHVSNGTLLDIDGNPTYDDNDSSTYTIQTFLTPHWGSVKPFAMTSGSQFRPPAPPQLGSDDAYTDSLGNVTTSDAAYRAQVADVLDISGNLTDELKVIAEFWADGPHTWTPPGHWVQLAIGVSLRDLHDIDDDVQMFMALTGAVLDAGISAWDAKRVYDFIRPISAIRYLYRGVQVQGWGGPNQGIVTMDGAKWQPYQSPTFVTPPFSEFTSGHSTFSRASAEALTAFASSPAMYDGMTLLGRDYDGDGAEDLFGRHRAEPGTLMFESGPASTVVLTWTTFQEAADEAGVSRRYGGIHFQDGDLRAREAGRQIGQQAYEWAELHWDPFGEMTQTANERLAAGNLTKGAYTAITKQIKAAAKSFTRTSSEAGCDQLTPVETLLTTHPGVDPVTQVRMGRQVGHLIASLCD